MKKIKNPFAFFGQKHEHVKTKALFHILIMFRVTYPSRLTFD